MSALWIQVRVMKMQAALTITVLTAAHVSKGSPEMEKRAKVNLLVSRRLTRHVLVFALVSTLHSTTMEINIIFILH